MNSLSTIGTILLSSGFLFILLVLILELDFQLGIKAIQLFFAGCILLFINAFKSVDVKNYTHWREKFHEKVKMFSEKGLIKSVYENNKFSVYNVANVGYYVFRYDEHSVEKFGAPIGIAFSKDTIEEMIKNSESINKYYSMLDEDYVKKHIVLLDVKTIDRIFDIKAETDEWSKKNDSVIDVKWELKINSFNNKNNVS